jgi:signal peptidase I
MNLKQRFRSFLNSLILASIVLLITYALTRTLCAPEYYRVVGNSMLPTLRHGDNTIAICKDWSKPITIKRKDIVIVERGFRYLVKRVVGLPGDRVEIVAGNLHINGVYRPDYEILLRGGSGKLDLTLGPQEYYVLGDNRLASLDSRSFGPVHRNDIKGKIVMRWTPIFLKRVP